MIVINYVDLLKCFVCNYGIKWYNCIFIWMLINKKFVLLLGLVEFFFIFKICFEILVY